MLHNFYYICNMKCLNCNSETTKWGLKYRKYCNISCQRQYESSSRKKSYKPRICKVCLNAFMPVSIRNIHCSKACKIKADMLKQSHKPKTKTCQFCKNEFKPYTSLDKFCSANCRVANVKSKRTWNWTPEMTNKILGKNNPCYRNGQSVRGAKRDSSGLRLFFRNRDEYKQDFIEKNGGLWCEKCGNPSLRLEAHHIIYRSEKPKHEHLHSKQNILLLCVPCHNWYHKSKSHRNQIVIDRGLNLLFGDDVLDK